MDDAGTRGAPRSERRSGAVSAVLEPTANVPRVGDPSRVTTVIFSCEGREHLLPRTLASFAEAVPDATGPRLLALDGPFAPSTADGARADLVLRRPNRSGYLRNILAALKQIETEYFFWLEDDWRFLEPVSLARLVGAMDAHPDWIQVRLSKTGRPGADARLERLAEDVYASDVGFSANPCLCRTALVREGFARLLDAPKGNQLGVDGFENVLTRWCDERGLRCAVFDSAGVDHLGYLESTPRGWHMTSSIDGHVATDLFTLVERPPLWRRVVMLGKLARRFARLALGQLVRDSDYEAAFRVVTVRLDDTPPAREAR